MKKILIFFSFIFNVSLIIAQTDTEFWYAFTSIDDQYGIVAGSPVSMNITLRIGTGAQPATVTVTFPGRPARNTTFNVAANSTYTYYIVNANPALQPNNKAELDFFNPYPNEVYPQTNGMYVSSTAKVSAYVGYEHGGDDNIFMMKGKSAIGQDFYLPCQTSFNPGGSSFSASKAYASFSIVATQDNTTVTITPTKALIGHPAGTPFNVTLNKGQTFTGFSPQTNPSDPANQPAGDQPVGTHITSDKNIAVTIATDLALTATGGVDMEGDQIVPVSSLGKSFIVYNSSVDQGNIPGYDDYFTFVATADNTVINFGGTNSPNLMKGQPWVYKWAHAANVSFKNVTSNQPVYCYQTGVIQGEVTSALIPSTEVGGSKSISFNLNNRPINGKEPTYRLYFECQTSTANGFSITLSNGATKKTYNSSNISFQPVNGKAGYEGGYLQFDMNTLPQFPSGQDVTFQVNNPNMFTLGVSSGTGNGSGVSAIFTDFVQQNNIEYYVLDSTICNPVYTLENGATNIAWYLPGRVPAPNPTSNPRTITESKVWVEYTNATGQNTTDTIYVYRFPIPNIPSKNFCPTKGETATFDATVDTQVQPTYLWSNGKTTSIFTASQTSDFGNYTVTITTKTCAIPVKTKAGSSCGLTIIFTADSICAGDTSIITANISGTNGPYSYKWSTGDSTINTASTQNKIKVSTNISTDYILTVSDVITGSKKIDTVTVIVNPLPVITSKINVNNNGLFNKNFISVCKGYNVLLSPIPAINNQWKWTGPNALSSNVREQQLTNIQTASSGTYVVTYIDNKGCSDTVHVTINVNNLPVVTYLPTIDSICFNASPINLSGGNPSGNGGVYSGNKVNAGVFTPSIIGANNLTYTYSDGNGCIDSAKAFITVSPIPVADILGKTIICNGESTTLTATGSTKYIWSTTETKDQILVKPNLTTTYTVSVSNQIGCSAKDTLVVKVVPIPVADFTADNTSGCMPLNINFKNNVNAADINYLWDFGDITSLTNSSVDENPSHTYKINGNYPVKLIVSTVEGGCKDTLLKDNYINVYALPVAKFTYNPMFPTSFNANVDFTDLATDAQSWLWNFDDNQATDNISIDKNPSHSFLGTGYFNVKLVVKNAKGCSDSTINPVHVKAEFTIYAPNAFTPNNDGVNDYFLPKGLGIAEDHYELQIYSRWGEEIYKTKDFYKGWNGNFNGSDGMPCQMGMYVWIINFNDLEGNQHQYKGMVDLLR